MEEEKKEKKRERGRREEETEREREKEEEREREREKILVCNRQDRTLSSQNSRGPKSDPPPLTGSVSAEWLRCLLYFTSDRFMLGPSLSISLLLSLSLSLSLFLSLSYFLFLPWAC